MFWKIIVAAIFIVPTVYFFVYEFIYSSIRDYIERIKKRLSTPADQITEKDITPDPDRWKGVMNSLWGKSDWFWLIIFNGVMLVVPHIFDSSVDSTLETAAVVVFGLIGFACVVFDVLFVKEIICNLVDYCIRRHLKNKKRRK